MQLTWGHSHCLNAQNSKGSTLIAIIDVKILCFQVIPDPGQSDNESGQWTNLKIVEREFENSTKMEEVVNLILSFIFCKICFFCFEYTFRLSSVLYGPCSGTLCVILLVCLLLFLLAGHHSCMGKICQILKTQSYEL